MEPTITPDIIKLCKSGDINAFDEIYFSTIDKVYYTVFVLASNKQEVDEIVNEIYFQLWKSISNFEESSSFMFWLNGLVIRQVKNWKLKAWKRSELFQKVKRFTIKETHSNEDVLKEHNKQWILSILDTLPYKLKEVLLLYYFHEYSLKEIAGILNVPIGTIKSRHHTALNQLRKNYGSLITTGEVGVTKW